MSKLDIHFDMETSDPDDVFTLCLLSHHPMVNLRSVSITPGSKQQYNLVRHILNKLELELPIGLKNENHPKECVSAFHYKWLGDIPSYDMRPYDGHGGDILFGSLARHPQLIVVCGGPLGNIDEFLKAEVTLDKIVVQGGFAGDNIVSRNHVLDKFKGKITCPTFNLNGNPQAALNILNSEYIEQKFFVSKNVCHGVVYDKNMHEFMLPHKNKNLGLNMMIDGMSHYIKNKPSGKAFHDPLAACAAINSDICEFKQVELYRTKGEWGSRISDNLNAHISVSVDMDKFKNIMIM